MKKLFSITLAVLLTFGVFAQSVSAIESETVQSEGAYTRWTKFDITEFPEAAAKYEANPEKSDIFANATDKETPKPIMDTICDFGYIVLPSFVDISATEKGEIFIDIDSALLEDRGADFTISGVSGGYNFRLLAYIERSKFMPQRKEQIPKMLPQKYYERENDMVRDVVGSLEYTAYAPGRFPYLDDAVGSDRNCYFEFSFDDIHYILIVEGIEHFDELNNNFKVQFHPFNDGFLRSRGKIYYYYKGEYLKGWYKIGGSRYYFKKDDSAATGVVKISGKYYSFAYDGKYRGLFSGIVLIGGEKYKVVDGVLEN
jgi:hypothetical protein